MRVAERTLKIERKPRPGPKMDELFQLVENKNQNQTIFGLLEKLKATESNNAMRTQIVRMFQLQSWPDKEKPSTESLESILYLNRLVELWQQNMALYRIDRPAVCVVSKDGAERCGVFCTLNQALDELGEEGTVDIFSAVRRVRNNRPELIKDTAEYRLCYKLVQHETRYQPSFDGNHNTSPLSPQTAPALSQDEDFEHPV
ncbi:receptor-type tyrosine-protein phosphatase epsilon-like [Lingula anatina]|uniref:Receptor-type tyrosine-protein phosphatase epsilon-like n=1 Tax=Lingula anatina TaxID=7574 RepID=A0A1S3HWG8_LINAN|nr:receptor-type tyrosine-protein phosphatase epsilon-like [Lingula anatina]|eukprot:XP_013390380.1 receptor-type tyrosine-protein phosphatase epsilon-like [Lingula anatina]